MLEDGEEKDDSCLYADAQHLVSLHSPHPYPLSVEILWFQAVVSQCFSNKWPVLWPRLVKSPGAWIKGISQFMAARGFFLCSVVYASSGIIWDDWLGCIWVQAAIAYSSIFCFEEDDISDHLVCFIPKMVQEKFYFLLMCLNSCGSRISCLWITKGSSIWAPVLTCFLSETGTG